MENFTKANQHFFLKKRDKLCLRVKTKFKVNTIKAWLIMEKVIPIVKSVHYCIPNAKTFIRISKYFLAKVNILQFLELLKLIPIHKKWDL